MLISLEAQALVEAHNSARFESAILVSRAPTRAGPPRVLSGSASLTPFACLSTPHRTTTFALSQCPEFCPFYSSPIQGRPEAVLQGNGDVAVSHEKTEAILREPACRGLRAGGPNSSLLHASYAAETPIR